jgi:hypothetical protein
MAWRRVCNGRSIQRTMLAATPNRRYRYKRSYTNRNKHRSYSFHGAYIRYKPQNSPLCIQSMPWPTPRGASSRRNKSSACHEGQVI